MRTPEQIERYNHQRRERYSNDPEYRERRKREWNEQYGSGSEGRHKRNARYRELRAQNLEAVRNRERRSRRCNTGLGLFGEDMDTLCAAAEYLCRETGNTPPGRTL